MFETIKNAWKIPDLRKKLFYTLFMIVIFRLGSHIPVPFMNANAIKALISSGGENNLLGFLDTVSGGSFGNATLFAMSITPYINASIIMQLLTVAIPYLERLSKEGEEWQKEDCAVVKIPYGCVGSYSGSRLVPDSFTFKL